MKREAYLADGSSKGKIRNFRDLDVWKLGRELEILNPAVHMTVLEHLDHQSKMLRNLIKKLDS